MDCPVCKSSMVALELDQVEVDYCTGCSGIWLDAGELELILESAEKRDEVIASLVPDKAAGEARRRCPICERKMEKVRLPGDDQRDIIIDRCKRNDGVWLDKGELQRIVRTGTGSDDGPVQRLLVDMFGGASR